MRRVRAARRRRRARRRRGHRRRGAEAVEGGDAEGGGEVAVAGAAGRALGQVEAERPADRADPLEQARRRPGVRSIGGRLKSAGDREASSRSDRRGAPASPPRPGAASSSVATRTSICAVAWAATTFEVGPALDDADVQGRPQLGSASAVDGEDLVRQLDDGAAPFSGSTPAWADRPSIVSVNWPTPLRAVFRPPPASGGSTTSVYARLPRLVLDQPARA